MSATTAPTSFLDQLEQSHLLSPKDWRRVKAAAERAGLLDKPDQLAEALVRKEILTDWQAKQLLDGRKAFFLGKYKLLRKIGSGGMGAVFQAMQVKSALIVAIKVVQQDRLENVASLARFRREIQAVSALHHPNIIKALDAESLGKTHFLVMEYVEGLDLNRWLKRSGPLPISWASECMCQAAMGLQYVFSKGLVHRDIKPANLLVAIDPKTSMPRVKILDLGLARFISENQGGELTQTGQILGTPDYIAPEQAKNTRGADIRADIYSLGATFYKILSGHFPFEGENAVEKLLARYTQEPQPIREHRPEIPPPLETIIQRMLARDPEQRYQTPCEVVEALRPFSLSGQRSAAPPRALVPPTVEETDSKASCTTSDESNGEDTAHFLQMLSNQQVSQETHARSMQTVPDSSDTTGHIRTTFAPRREPASTWPWAVGFVACLVCLWAGSTLWYHHGQPKILVHWPLAERAGAKLYIDEQRYQLSKEEEVSFEIPVSFGTHDIRVDRQGYRTIQHASQFTLGTEYEFTPRFLPEQIDETPVDPVEPSEDPVEPTPMKPPLEPKPAKSWQELQQEFGPLAKQAWPDRELAQLQQAREQLRAYLQESRVTAPERVLAKSMLARLANPLDAFASPELGEDWKPGQTDLPVVGLYGTDQLVHPGSIMLVDFLDRNRLISISHDGTAKIFVFPYGQSQGQIQTNFPVYQAAFSPQAKYVAFSGVLQSRQPKLVLWDVEANKLRECQLPAQVNLMQLVFLDEQTLAAGGLRSGDLRFWDAKTGEMQESISADPTRLTALEVSPDGRWLATGGSEGLKLWQLPLQKHPAGFPLQVEAPPQSVSAFGQFVLSFSQDSRKLFVYDGRQRIQQWDVAQRELEQEFEFQAGYVRSLSVSHDGKFLAVAGSRPALRVFDLEQAQEVVTASISSPIVHDVTFHPLASELVVIGDGTRVRLVQWDSSGQFRLYPPGHVGPLAAMTWDEQGEHLITLGIDGQRIHWKSNVNDPVQIDALTAEGIRTAAVSQDRSRMLAVTSDEKYLLFDTNLSPNNPPEELEFALPQRGRTVQVALGPEGKQLVAAHFFGVGKLWLHLVEMEEQAKFASKSHLELTQPFQGLNLLMHPSGDHVWTSSFGYPCQAYRIGQQLKPDGKFSPPGRFVWQAFDPTGRYLWGVQPELRSTQGQGRQTRKLGVWDTQQNRFVLQKTYRANVCGAAFAYHSQRVAVVLQDGSVQVQSLTQNAHALHGQIPPMSKAAGMVKMLPMQFGPEDRHLLVSSAMGYVAVLRLEEPTH